MFPGRRPRLEVEDASRPRQPESQIQARCRQNVAPRPLVGTSLERNQKYRSQQGRHKESRNLPAEPRQPSDHSAKDARETPEGIEGKENGTNIFPVPNIAQEDSQYMCSMPSLFAVKGTQRARCTQMHDPQFRITSHGQARRK